MKASQFTDAQKAFMIELGEDGTSGLPQGGDQPRDVLQLKEIVHGAVARGDAAAARA